MAIHKLRALEYLLAVVEHGGFAAAARRLGVSTPSVHRLVSALEVELGIPLLDRDSSPIRATADGRHYVERARGLVRELQGLDASLHDQAAAPTGTIVVAAHSVAIDFFLAEALPHFHAQFPRIVVDLRDAGVSRDLAQLDADALLHFGWPPQQEALLRTLAHTRWLIVGAPLFWAKHGTPSHPRELAHLPCALFRTPYGEVLRKWTFVRGRERVEVAVDGWLIGDDRAALDAPVLAGQMAARVNDLTALQALRNGRLQPVLLDWDGEHSPPLSLVLRKSIAKQPRVRAFVGFVADRSTTLVQHRLPAGLAPVKVAKLPQWFKRRVG